MRISLFIIILFFTCFTEQALSNHYGPRLKNNLPDTVSIYVIYQRDCNYIEGMQLKNNTIPKYWVDDILEATRVKTGRSAVTDKKETLHHNKITRKEDIKPYDEIRIDKYYWLHSLDKQTPEII